MHLQVLFNQKFKSCKQLKMAELCIRSLRDVDMVSEHWEIRQAMRAE